MKLIILPLGRGPSRVSSMEKQPMKKQKKDATPDDPVDMEEDPLEISLNRTESSQ